MKKLQLSKETIHTLNSDASEGIVGGGVITYNFTCGVCGTRYCDTQGCHSVRVTCPLPE